MNIDNETLINNNYIVSFIYVDIEKKIMKNYVTGT